MRRKRKKVSRNFTVLNKVVLIINCICALCLLLSYLAPSTDPRDLWIIAILGLGYPLLLIANLVFIIYWLFFKKLLSLISAICIVIGFNAIIQNIGFHTDSFPDKKASPEVIRLMSYNAHEFVGIGSSEGESKLKENLKFIRNVNPDIINFVEYNTKTPDSIAVVDSVKKALNANYYYFKAYDYVKRSPGGNCIYSKFPIVNSGFVDTKGLKFIAIFVDIKYINKIFRVYCIHLEGVHFKVERTKLNHGKVSADQSSLVITKLKVAYISRTYQVSLIKKHMDACPYPYIIAGDFDDTPVSFAVNELSDGLKNAFIEKGSGFGFTYDEMFPLQLDYIFTTSQFDVLNYQVIDKNISDHKPIVSDLKLN